MGRKQETAAAVQESYWPPAAQRYVEPFAGSAALFFHLAPRRALLADTNHHLISTYQQVEAHPRAVTAALMKVKKNRQAYSQLRGLGEAWGGLGSGLNM